MSKAERKAMAERMEAIRAEVRKVVERGECPLCGAGVHRNTSLAGWWQCDRLGAPGFRKNPTGPACHWQGFTE